MDFENITKAFLALLEVTQSELSESAELVRREYQALAEHVRKLQSKAHLDALEKLVGSSKSGDEALAVAFFFDGASNFQSSDAKKAVEMFKVSAERGNSIACVHLAGKFVNGTGVEKNATEAKKYYLKGAELGNPMAQHKMAMYSENEKPPKKADALSWFQKAAAQNYLFSMHGLASLLLEQSSELSQPKEEKETAEEKDTKWLKGVTKSPSELFEEALTLLNKCADRGYALSLELLGRIHYGGLNVERNEELGLHYLQRAADQGLGLAQELMGIHYAARRDMANARKYFLSAVESGQTSSIEYLKMVSGDTSPKDQLQMAKIKKLVKEDDERLEALKASANLKKQAGNKEFSKKNFIGAKQLYTEAIRIDADNHLLYSNRAAANLELKLFAEALEDSERCLSRDRSFSKGHFRKALALEGLSRSNEAILSLALALKCVEGNDSAAKATREEINDAFARISKSLS